MSTDLTSSTTNSSNLNNNNIDNENNNIDNNNNNSSIMKFNNIDNRSELNNNNNNIDTIDNINIDKPNNNIINNKSNSNKRKQSSVSNIDTYDTSIIDTPIKPKQYLSLYTLDPIILTQSICNRFNESKIYLIEMVVKYLGNPSTLKLYFDTVRIQKNGGLLKKNGIRRSNGGVFMELFKNKLTNKEWKIFNNRIKEEDKIAKNRKIIELDKKLAEEIDKLLLNGEDMEQVDE